MDFLALLKAERAAARAVPPLCDEHAQPKAASRLPLPNNTTPPQLHPPTNPIPPPYAPPVPDPALHLLASLELRPLTPCGGLAYAPLALSPSDARRLLAIVEGEISAGGVGGAEAGAGGGGGFTQLSSRKVGLYGRQPNPNPNPNLGVVDATTRGVIRVRDRVWVAEAARG